jgi:hypothetical protein
MAEELSKEWTGVLALLFDITTPVEVDIATIATIPVKTPTCMPVEAPAMAPVTEPKIPADVAAAPTAVVVAVEIDTAAC